MPMVLDSFVLELGLDSSRFTKGQRDAMDSLRKMEEVSLASGRAIESQSKKVFDLLSSFRREAVATLGIFFGGRGAAEFLNFITGLDASTARFSRTIGTNVREVSAWQGAFEQIGGSAESANSALGGLSGEMSRFQLTGQSGMLPVLSRLGISLYDQNRNLKTAGELWLDLADAVSGMDPRQATAFLNMIPGANQDMINFALMGRKAMQQYIDAARQAGTTTEESAAAALEYQKNMALLDRSATSLGRTLITAVAPALVTVMDKMRGLLQIWNTSPESAAGKAIVSGNRDALVSRFGDPRGIMQWMRDNLSVDDADRGKWDAIINSLYGSAGGSDNWANFLSGLSYLETSQTNAQRTARHSASGFFQFQPATASRATAAGITDPRSGNYASQAASTMAYIKRFHPEAAAAIDRGDFGPAIAALRGEWPSLPGGGQAQSAARYQTFNQELRGGGPRPGGGSSTVTVGSVNVYAPNAKDADGIAKEIAPALKRSLSAGAANTGAQ